MQRVECSRRNLDNLVLIPHCLSIKRSDERQAETLFINILSEDIKKIVSYNYAVSYSDYNFVLLFAIISKTLVVHYNSH